MASNMPSLSRHVNLPKLIASTRIPRESPDTQDPAVYDVKFCPFSGDDAIFAVTGGQNTIVCRPSLEHREGLDIIQWLKDKNPNAGLNSIAWCMQEKSSAPLLCVAGTDRVIKILDPVAKELKAVLVGHGAAINDLVVSPTSPNLIASASEDKSIRIWNIHPKHEKRPCQLIYAGEAHTSSVLTLAFHHTGKYLLSGGMDNRINMWAIPETSNKSPNTDKTSVLQYPHFSTFEVHYDYVDCVAFYGDLIISKCVVKSLKDGHILVWQINGFSSSKPTPDAPPTFYRDGAESRSAFGKGHKLLLSLKCPHTESYYMRFGLFHQPEQDPILAMANAKTEVYFWNLHELESNEPGHSAEIDTISIQKRKRRTNRPNVFEAFPVPKRPNQHQSNVREDSVVSSTSSVTTQPSSVGSNPIKKKMWDIGDPFTPLEPHKKVIVPQVKFRARGVDWSKDGDWCVVVGDEGMISVFHKPEPE